MIERTNFGEPIGGGAASSGCLEQCNAHMDPCTNASCWWNIIPWDQQYHVQVDHLNSSFYTYWY